MVESLYSAQYNSLESQAQGRLVLHDREVWKTVSLRMAGGRAETEEDGGMDQ